MVEMTEAANILNNATERSLVILDEIGRGTSTYDGMAIARAVVEYLHHRPEVGAKTLFATHYHELVDLANQLPRVRNENVAVAEEDGRVVFLHKIVPGGADRSYGIHVAELAGLPKAVVQRAREVLAALEDGSAPLTAGGARLARRRPSGVPVEQMPLLPARPQLLDPRLQPLPRLLPQSQFGLAGLLALDQLPHRDLHRALEAARTIDRPGHAEQLRPVTAFRADAREPVGAALDDVRDVAQGLDVVDHRRLAEQPLDGGKRRLDPRPGPFALEAFDQSRLFAADVGGRTAMNVDVQ
jgi:hypothetical protein